VPGARNGQYVGLGGERRWQGREGRRQLDDAPGSGIQYGVLGRPVNFYSKQLPLCIDIDGQL